MHEMPLRILCAAPGDVLAPALVDRALVPAEECVPETERYTMRHAGAKLMVDHLLVSRSLRSLLLGASIRNRELADDAVPADDESASLAHAAFVAEFALPG
jgi:hypothetical protein